MSTRDENDELDDPMLHSMRSVWQEMRDEEPSTDGLAALMAAARSKADEMRPAPVKEPWWQRFAFLLRPPMLAAATAVLLVGGTVILTRRGVDTATAPATAELRSDELAKQPERPRDASAKKELEMAPGGAPTGTAAGSAISARDNTQAAVVAKPPVRPAPPRKAAEVPVAPSQDSLSKNAVVQGADKLEENEEKTPDPPKADAPKTGKVQIATDGVPETAGRPIEAAPEATRPKPEAVARPPAGPNLDQLIKQAESAASRNDCLAVKATAERIRKLDNNAYKSRVATQAAIARCLRVAL